MHVADYLVLLLYGAGVLAVGFGVRRRTTSRDEFFLAGRSMHWIPVGLSVMVTVFNAVNFVGLSGEVFRHGLYVTVAFPVFVLVGFPVTRIFMPFYHSLRVTSAYEFLEKRFDQRVRCLGSGLFVLWRLFWMATALFASGKVLHLVTGLPLIWLIVAGGLAATAYTASGGMRAVMWTDVAQFAVLFGGIVAAVVFTTAGVEGGLPGVLQTAFQGGRLRPVAPFDPGFLSLDPTRRITLWSGLLGVTVAFSARYGADQVVVQRYFAARSLKHARRGFWLNVAAVLLSLSLLVLFGLAVHARHADAGTLGKAGPMPVVYVVRMIKALPPGICGLIAAGLLAATMSSLDSGINACCAAYTIDFRQVLSRGARPQTDDPGRFCSAAVGVAATVAAVALIRPFGTNQSLFVVVNRVVNGLGSPLLAIVLLGMFSRRASAGGTFWGGIAGTAASIAVSFGVDRLALHYYAVVNLLLTLGACYAGTWFAARAGHGVTRDQLNWTWWAQQSTEPERRGAMAAKQDG